MSDDSMPPVEERRRKRVRKGTRSCWECKRRKIKCIYQSDDHSRCVSCLEKSTTCLSQEYVDDRPPRNVEAPDSALGQRMEKVETLLEKLMQKMSRATEERRAPSGSSAPSTTFNSVFDDALAQQVEADSSMLTPQSTSNSNLGTLATTVTGSPVGRIEKLRRRLTAMLPCQEDVDQLSDWSRGWWLIRRHIMPHLLGVPEDDLQNPFNVATASVGHPMVIARLLLCVALCIQQLPPDIDPRRLHTKIPLRDMIEKIITFVTATVTSDDELVGSMEGIECLVLQALYQVNAGNLRRSWLVFRRAINVAQLMGFHRTSLKTSHEPPDLMETRRHYMWYQIMRGERYLSLLLGLPSATAAAPFPFEDYVPWLSTEERYNKHLCDLSGLILARNQGDATEAFSSTQEIDQKLEALAQTVPPAWWEVPTSLIDGRTEEAAAQFERLTCQIWHFELQTLVNLPFMLRAATDRRYAYSYLSCLSASRGLLRRWTAMREVQGITFVSNLVEFQAFSAATTLLLGLLGPAPSGSDTTEREADLQLVDTVITVLERLKRAGSGVHVVNQSISVLRTLQGVLHDQDSGTAGPATLRLVIPHFGTISIARGGAVQSLAGERIVGANPRAEVDASPLVSAGEGSVLSSGDPKVDGNDAWAAMQNSMVQLQSSQFPTFEMQPADLATEWPFQESETMFFDGVLNTDMEGSWSF